MSRRRAFWPRRFRSRIALLFSAGLTAALAGFFAFALVYMSSEVRKESMAQYAFTAEAVAGRAGFALITGRDDLQEEFLASSATDPHIVSSFLYAEDGGLIAVYGAPLGEVGFPDVEDLVANTNGAYIRSGHWLFIAPVMVRSATSERSETFGPPGPGPEIEDVAGHYGFVVRSDYLGHLVRTLSLGLLAAAALIGTLTIGVLFGATRRLLDPLARLVRTTREAEASQYAARAAVKGPEEVRALARAMNELLERVFADKERLEAAVKARTRDEAEARRIAEDKSREAEDAAAQRNLIMSVNTHEILTPLRIIDNAVREIKEQTDFLSDRDSADDIMAHLDVIQPQISRIDDIIGHLNLFLEISAGRIQARKSWVDLETLARELADVFAVLAAQTGIALSIHSEIGDHVHTDQAAVRSIMYNLLSNACKFAAGGAVTLTVRGAEGGFEIICADNGAGIAADMQDLIFEPLRQADMSTTRPVGGIGLGLSIVQGYVRLLGGAIELESTEGEGATFTVFIPAERRPVCGPVRNLIETPASTRQAE